MTTEEKVKLVKTFLGSDTVPDDDVILAYLEVAEQRITEAEYPFRDTEAVNDDGEKIWAMSKKYEKAQCELASRMLFRVGFQGQTGSNENGIIREWASADDIDILNRITPKVGF